MTPEIQKLVHDTLKSLQRNYPLGVIEYFDDKFPMRKENPFQCAFDKMDEVLLTDDITFAGMQLNWFENTILNLFYEYKKDLKRHR